MWLGYMYRASLLIKSRRTMYYPDLTCYRINSFEKESIVYPSLINIGWLDKTIGYPKGEVPTHLTQKLKEILFLDIKNSEDSKEGSFEVAKAILIHDNHMRGSAYECPFCNPSMKIFVEPDGLDSYHGKRSFLLGTNEIILPSSRQNRFYAIPTMIYHYIVSHKYSPPKEFLNALDVFDLSSPFNIHDISIESLMFEPLKIPMIDVNSFDPDSDIDKYERYEDDWDEDY
jgi:hypothetical protein